MTRRASLALAFVLAACSPEPAPAEGHLVVYVDTDAIVPNPPGEPPRSEPAPLFDRLRLEILAPTGQPACKGCVLDIEVHTRTFTAPATFTFVAREGAIVHAQLYRALSVDTPEVPSSVSVEAFVALPPPAHDGATPVALLLATDTIGAPMGSLARPAAPVPGIVVNSRVGSWAPGRAVACTAARASEREVCVHGGAFWMGSLRERRSDDFAADRPRLVVISPFYMDDHEVTVAEFRAFLGPASLADVYRRITPGGARADNLCNYTVSAGPYETEPANCVTVEAAGEYCAARGMQLPSEAEFEYVAGGRRSLVYPWGNDEPGCDDAVWGLATTVLVGEGGSGACLARDAARRAVPGGTFALPTDRSDGALTSAARHRDRLSLPGGAIFDLAGSVSEWTRDRFATQDEACWHRDAGNLFVDPVCSTSNRADHAVRGGSWALPQAQLRAAARRAQYRVGSASLGFRCVRPGK